MNYQQPQLRIFQTFGESTTARVSSLAPCIVAPFYDVHADQYAGAYDAEAATFPYLGMSGDDMIMENDLTGVFSVTLKNAQAQGYAPLSYSSTAGAAGCVGSDGKSIFTGMIVADGGGFPVPAGFPSLKVGDTVVVENSGTTETHKIAAFQRANATAHSISLPTYETLGEHAAQDATLGGSHALDADTLLKFVITTGGTVGTDTVKATLYLDGVAVQSDISCSASAVSLTADGLTSLNITFASGSAWAAGDTVTFGLGTTTNASAAYNQGYATIILDDAIDETLLTTGTTFTFYYGVGDIVDPVGATWTTEGLSLAATLEKGGLNILSGDVYMTYRIRKNEYTSKVYTVSRADVKGLLGAVHPLNPLSVMCGLALRNSDSSYVGFVAVQFDNLESYQKAFDAIGVTNAVWSIIPYSEDEAIQRRAANTALFLSNAVNMNWKTAWLGKDTADEITVLATMSGTVASSDLKKVVKTTGEFSDIKFGDTFVMTGGAEYTVMGVVTTVSSPYFIVDADLPTGTVSGKIIRKLSAEDKAAEVGAYARSYNSERVRVFYADGPYLVDFPEADCPMSYLAAAWAGKRAGSAPHQPLTRLPIDGIATRGDGGFTTTQLDYMGSMGVWLTVTDNNGLTYCRHQLTTKNADENYNLKEDSKVSNADEISMTFRSMLDGYYGRMNVTDPGLEVIRMKVEEVVLTVQARVWSDLLGPQVTSLNSLEVERDANFSDRVNVFADFTTPDPLNNLDVYLTIR